MDGAPTASDDAACRVPAMSGSRSNAHPPPTTAPPGACLPPPSCSKARLNFGWADYEGQFSAEELDAFDAAYEKRKAAPRGELAGGGLLVLGDCR